MKQGRLIWLATVVTLCTSSAALAAITLDELIEGVRRQEDAFHGVEVEARLQCTRNGVFAGDARVRALYDASPYGKVRVDFLELKLPWVGGSAPTSTNVESYSFDGTTGQSVLYQIGSADAAAIPLEGKILPEEPSMIRVVGNHSSGWTASLYGAAYLERLPLSSLLTMARDAQRDGKAEVAVIELPDGKTVEVQVTAKAANVERVVLRFASDRGFALLQYARYYADLPVQTVRIDSFLRDGDRYFPGRFTRELYDHTGKVVETQSGEVSRVKFTDAAGIPPEKFKITWPAGGTVTNESTGAYIRIGHPPAETRKQLDTNSEQFQKPMSVVPEAATSRPSEAPGHPG